ncbi:putative ribonuclease H-like domain-containing protein [Tanacetum coccineum]
MSDHDDDASDINNDNAQPQQQQNIQPQIITTVSNNNAKFPYLKKDEYEVWAMKMEYWITNNDMNIWKRESKARTTLLQSIPDDHVADFHYMDDARDIWNAVKARFGGNDESKKMRKSMLKQEFSKFRISLSEGLHKGYDRMQKILSQLNQLKAKPNDEDINLKFLRGLPSSWLQVALSLKTKLGLELLSFDDLYYKLKTLKIDIKGYSPSHSAFVSTTSTSKKMSYPKSPSFSSSTTYSALSSFKARSHSSSNVLHSLVAESEPEQQVAYEDFEQIDKLDLEEMDIKWQMAMLAKGGNEKRYSSFKIQELGKKEADTKALITCCEVYSLITGNGTDAAVEEFALMAWPLRLIDSSMSVRTKVGLGFNNYISENELGWDDSAFSVFTTNSEEVEGRPLFNRFAKADSMKAVPPPLSGDYTPLSDHIDLDESPNIFGTKSSTSGDSNYVSNDFVSCDNSDKSLEVNTNDFASSDYSVKSSEPKLNDSTSCASTSSGHFRKNNSSASKSCFVCGSYLHLIKDCNYYETQYANDFAGVSYLKREQMWDNATRPNQVPAGRPKPVSTGALVIHPYRWGMKGLSIVVFWQYDWQQRKRWGYVFQLLKSLSICDKKNRDFFTDTDCLSSPRFSNSQMKDGVTQRNFGCWVANASSDEAVKWHRRMGHVNYKNMNKLVKDNLVRGLPPKLFKNDHTCVACCKGKQHKATYKAITVVSSIYEPLQLLHMDLFGPTSIRSIDHKYYCLVITDDYSRFCWVFFLETKDETYPILKDFISLVENQLNKKVKAIRCDNGTEFKNAKLIELCGEKGIKRDYSNARTSSKTRQVNPSIFNFKPFGCHVTILNTSDHLGKFDEGVKGILLDTLPSNRDEDSDSDSVEHVILVHLLSFQQTFQELSIRTRGTLMLRRLGLGFAKDAEELKKRASATTVPPGCILVPTGSILVPSGDTMVSPSDVSVHQELGIKVLSPGISLLTFYDDGLVLNLINLASTVEVSPVATKRINTVHPQSLIIGEPNSSVQTRSQAEMQQFKFQNVWILVDLPEGKYAIGTKWILKNKRDARGIVVRNKARLVAQGHRRSRHDYVKSCRPLQRYRGNQISAFFMEALMRKYMSLNLRDYVASYISNKVYKVVKALYGYHQAPRASQRDISWYKFNVDGTSSLLDLLEGWCDEFEALMKGEFEMSAMEKLIFFLGLQVQQRPDGIFIGQDNSACSRNQVTPTTSNLEAVKKIFKYLKAPKLGLWYHRGEVDLMAICKKQTIVATSSTEAEYVVAANCCGQGMVSNIGNAKKFLMYPRFLQTILGIETSFTRQYRVFKLSSKLFANMKLNFEGQPMQLLAAMLPTIMKVQGVGETNSPAYHAISKKVTQAPPAGHTSGGAEDLITLTALSSVVFTFVHKVNYLETELKAHKKLFKDVVGKLVKKVKAMEDQVKEGVVSDYLDQKRREQAVDLDASNSHLSKAVEVGTEVEMSASQRETRQAEVLSSAKHYSDADWIDIMAQVHANAGLSSELLGADVNDDNFAERMVALINQRKRAFAEQTAKEKRANPMTLANKWNNETEFEKIRMAVADLKSQELRRTLKRAGEALEPDTSKKQKSTEAPIPSVPDVPQPPVVSSPKSSGTRRKSLGRSRITKPKSILTELDLDADDTTFIKVVSDEDSKDEAPILWSAFAGWEVISTPLGEINALYMMDQSTKHFTTLREILHMVDRQDLLKLYGLVVKYYENHPVAGAGLVLWGDLQVLMDSQAGGKGSLVWNHQSHWQIRSWRLYTLSNVHVLETVSGEVLYMFSDVSYPLSVKLMERMLKHKLEIDKDVVGNDMTTAEQLIRFIKNQIAAAQVSPA